MNPIEIKSSEFGGKGVEVIYAKDQPEYLPLPTLRFPDGLVVSKWEFTESERNLISEGAPLYLAVSTFNQPLQPIRFGFIPEEIVG